ncbi:hypothetical protein DPMN_037175 [Dreissena polymorpha]|uniref:Uncharacterized protein n=1 Tax=Dreissena polymorpha TaxID=45954 RepID=A0A9D4MD03_DREPO|nr:hypothetical protein DPMN_037175 [Dreissena polymorpha]
MIVQAHTLSPISQTTAQILPAVLVAAAVAASVPYAEMKRVSTPMSPTQTREFLTTTVVECRQLQTALLVRFTLFESNILRPVTFTDKSIKACSICWNNCFTLSVSTTENVRLYNLTCETIQY